MKAIFCAVEPAWSAIIHATHGALPNGIAVVVITLVALGSVDFHHLEIIVLSPWSHSHTNRMT